MILQALTSYYEDLVKKDRVPKPGWGLVRISYALVINKDGRLTDVLTTKVPDIGKETLLIPQMIQVPAPVKRASGIQSNFLWDHSGYLLGVDDKGKPARTRECFEACKQKHKDILEGLDEPGAKALLSFFENWNPEIASDNPILKDYWEDLISGANLVFRYEGKYLQEIPEIGARWEQYYFKKKEGVEMTCLVTGKKGPVEAIHPPIKGIRDAQSSGAALVSFNAPAFCSYGKEQNYNAPMSQYAAFAYTSALNYLIADREHVNYIGDTAVLCWAQGAEPAYQGLTFMSMFGAGNGYTEQDILDKVRHIASGNSVEFDSVNLDPNRAFYILGIAPNAARLSVRFFYKNSFGAIIKNIENHYKRMEIIRPANDKFPIIPLWKMLSETVNSNSRDKVPSHIMAGEVLRSVLTDTRYPATLLNGVNLRIRAEHKITHGRAAILKAYYMKNRSIYVPEEVLQVALNKESTNVGYNLGRLFSVLESIQATANPNINTTIRDKYFNSASATPGNVFPTLINLAQKHLNKIGGGLQVVLNKELTEILGKLDENFPTRMNLQEQGSFQLGYYHQTQTRYQGKKEEE